MIIKLKPVDLKGLSGIHGKLDHGGVKGDCHVAVVPQLHASAEGYGELLWRSSSCVKVRRLLDRVGVDLEVCGNLSQAVVVVGQTDPGIPSADHSTVADLLLAVGCVDMDLVVLLVGQRWWSIVFEYDVVVRVVSVKACFGVYEAHIPLDGEMG